MSKDKVPQTKDIELQQASSNARDKTIYVFVTFFALCGALIFGFEYKYYPVAAIALSGFVVWGFAAVHYQGEYKRRFVDLWMHRGFSKISAEKKFEDEQPSGE
jgi:hypothetical protein